MRSGKEHVSHSHQKYRKALVRALDGAIRAAARLSASYPSSLEKPCALSSARLSQRF